MTTGEMAAAPPRKHGGPGQPWLDEETAHLIDAYEERWYALKRGQLKAHQWDEVAAGVAARLGLSRPHKSGTQCRHKMEKLRQRYRAERRRPAPSRWLFFDRMDRMERGPLPISARPPPLTLPPPAANGGDKVDEEEEEEQQQGEEEEEEEDEEEEEEEADNDSDEDSSDADSEEREEEAVNGNMRSINGILREDNWGYPSRSSRYWEEGGGGDGETGAMKELVATVQRFREGFLRVEKKRLELMKEMERDWMEMEAKRAEMVVASQRHMLDTIDRAFRSSKKPRTTQEM